MLKFQNKAISTEWGSIPIIILQITWEQTMQSSYCEVFNNNYVMFSSNWIDLKMCVCVLISIQIKEFFFPKQYILYKLFKLIPGKFLKYCHSCFSATMLIGGINTDWNLSLWKQEYRLWNLVWVLASATTLTTPFILHSES